MESLRRKIQIAIAKAFEEAYLKHGESYNPDTTGDAADKVIAVLLSEITGDDYDVKQLSNIIGHVVFERVVIREDTPILVTA
jgi:hypothetical protein